MVVGRSFWCIAEARLATICVAEDRIICEPALKLLLLSLSKHCSNTVVNVFYPPADRKFQDWVKRFPQVTLHLEPFTDASHWNVKPYAMLFLLDQGFEEVIWLDSDVIVTRDICRVIGRLDNETLVITEEALWGAHEDPGAIRARLSGLSVGRILPFALNTAVMRVTKFHYPILFRWRETLESKSYRDSQLLHWTDRPPHQVGDQDVMTALLTSVDFSNIPLRILLRGRDIIQFFGLYGYTLYERILNLIGQRPAFIHSQGHKPWRTEYPPQNARVSLRKYAELLYIDLSPYTLSAISLRKEFDEDTSWMDAHFLASAMLRVGGFWCLPLVGLPIALIVDIVRLAKRFGLDRVAKVSASSVRDAT